MTALVLYSPAVEDIVVFMAQAPPSIIYNL